MTNVSEIKLTRGALVHEEVMALAQRLSREGFASDEILAGLVAVINDLIASASNQATAAAYFYGMVKQAAVLAGAELGFKPDD